MRTTTSLAATRAAAAGAPAVGLVGLDLGATASAAPAGYRLDATNRAFVIKPDALQYSFSKAFANEKAITPPPASDGRTRCSHLPDCRCGRLRSRDLHWTPEEVPSPRS